MRLEEWTTNVALEWVWFVYGPRYAVMNIIALWVEAERRLMVGVEWGDFGIAEKLCFDRLAPRCFEDTRL